MTVDAVLPDRVIVRRIRRPLRLVTTAALRIRKRDLAVVYLHRAEYPAGRAVASITVGRCRDMGGRQLPYSDLPVVTGDAGRRGLGMVHALQRHPSLRAMTGLAQVAGQRMTGRLAFDTHTIVAAGTAAADTAVVEYRGHPCGGPVAVVTGIRAGEMIDRLAERGNTIVATGTCAGGIEMVEEVNVEGPLSVTLAAVEAGRQVSGRLAGCQQLVVAFHAACRCAAEYPVSMAVVTHQHAV